MDVEIQEFYPKKKNKSGVLLSGSLHVYVNCKELNADLRGIGVIHKKPNFWFFNIPWAKGIDPETGKEVKFPVLSFLDKQRNRDLIEAIREKAIPYITENFIK